MLYISVHRLPCNASKSYCSIAQASTAKKPCTNQLAASARQLRHRAYRSFGCCKPSETHSMPWQCLQQHATVPWITTDKPFLHTNTQKAFGIILDMVERIINKPQKWYFSTYCAFDLLMPKSNMFACVKMHYLKNSPTTSFLC